MKTVAVTLDSVGGPVQVETLDLSEPLDGEVLVKMGAAGITRRARIKGGGVTSGGGLVN